MEAYLDNSATTRCYTKAAKLMYDIMTEHYGNTSSLHTKGVEAERYKREAAKIIARSMKVEEKEICFTSGGTESDNLALLGCARANRRAGNHLITTCIEHAAVLNTMRGGGRLPCDLSSGGRKRCGPPFGSGRGSL